MDSFRVLHYDILLAVLRYCDRSTLCALIGVNRSLYEGAAISLLREPVVIRELGTKLAAVIQFISADNGRRLPYVRNLQIEVLWLSTTSEDLLHIHVGGMKNLQRLTLRHPEVLLSRHPQLASAFAALEGIEEFAAIYAGQLTCIMLRSMRSRLRRVWLDGNTTLKALPDPVEMLSQMSPSLEELECGALWIHTHSVAPYPIFPNMRKFHIEGVRSPITSRYADAFPGLTHLLIVSPEGDILQGIVQTAGPDPHPHNIGPRPTWRALREVVGATIDVYHLGLRHHVPCLRVEVSRLMQDEVSFLSTVLDNLRPVNLSLSMPTAFLSGTDKDGHSLAALLSTPAAMGLSCLELYAACFSGERSCVAELPNLLENPLTAARRLSLGTLVIHWTSRLAMTPSDAEESIRFVNHLLEQVPSLKTAELRSHCRYDIYSLHDDRPFEVTRAVRPERAWEEEQSTIRDTFA
ncbi:hypothetical protein OH76DRAFT_1400439 [Lentinus brumalis]|uniref:F-box domain-containing protein n=1 Tax=Lentinus brumalis TaxID=2498619 RepID=A0A371DJB9_9APHY|nr:hypothetical protein OH76DRAFT_1400439 [Polyporus brumalis]